MSAQQPAQPKPATVTENDVEPEPPKSSMAKPVPVDEQVPQFEIIPPKEEVDFQQMKTQMEQHQLKQSSSAAKVSSSSQQSQQVQQIQQVQQTQQVQQIQQVQQTQQVQQNQQSIPAASQGKDN